MSKRKIEDIKAELEKELDHLDHRKLRWCNHEEELEEAQHYVDHYARLIKQSEETVGRLRQELEEAKKPKTIWDLEDFDEHYLIYPAGEVVRDTWFGSLPQNKRRDMGNVFLTEREAGDEARARKLIQKARESQNGFVPDWENFEQAKNFVYFDSGEIRILSHDYRDIAPIFGYWEDESVCEQFIQDNRDELLWYFTEYRR